MIAKTELSVIDTEKEYRKINPINELILATD